MDEAAAEQEIRLNGLPISEGVVLAKVHFIDSDQHASVPYYLIEEADIEAEEARLTAALNVAVDELEALIQKVSQRIGEAQANIFVAQKLMVEDPHLREEMQAIIRRRRLNAETALENTFDTYEEMLSEVDNDYLRERASDIGEIKRRVLEILRKSQVRQEKADDHLHFQGYRIVVAEELTPSQTVNLDTDRTVGFITHRGGAASHAAILARAMGIPAISGITPIRQFIGHDGEVLLNGASGEVTLNPAAATLKLYPSARRKSVARYQLAEPVEGFRVMGNISLSTEVDALLPMLPEGIGLYRTELEFLAAGRLLSEEDQTVRYRRVIEAMNGQPVYFRLADFGGDKSAPFLNLDKEENPCLGFRGARLLLEEPELLHTQARALARAAGQGPLHVLYPMIIDLDQFLILRERFLQSVADFDTGIIHHGVMFEVPSAALQAKDLLAVADFASIGSNDLFQYFFAVDRNNPKVAKDFTPDHELFWQVLRHLVEAARENSRPLSLCGEIAGQAQFIPKLIEVGIRQVSVGRPLLGRARLAAKRALPEE